MYAQRDFYSVQPPQDGMNEAMQYTNHSKHGDNWLGGPHANIKAQHIPGYQGFVPQIKSENLFGKNFARTTSKAINKEYNPGANPPQKERFCTQN